MHLLNRLTIADDNITTIACSCRGVRGEVDREREGREFQAMIFFSAIGNRGAYEFESGVRVIFCEFRDIFDGKNAEPYFCGIIDLCS